MRVLDLFSGQGGAAEGYRRAGFKVTCVDNRRMPLNPFEFVQADAFKYARKHGHEYDLIHASPPCQASSVLGNIHPEAFHYELVTATRAMLEEIGTPWVIENVIKAPMRTDVMLCGTMFDLELVCRDGLIRQLQRHRIFEATFPLGYPGACVHIHRAIGVYGNGGGQNTKKGYKATNAEAKKVMDIPWASRTGVSQAIPPAYTEWIGQQFLNSDAANDRDDHKHDEQDQQQGS